MKNKALYIGVYKSIIVRITKTVMSLKYGYFSVINGVLPESFVKSQRIIIVDVFLR